ncbi:tRNA (adenosine(37)-N6)-dimethylallyltransferase MiaA [Sphingobacteriales bacterium UPWRP_1]|nr:tRNA (adenosine(37)-N6)-dimethylallyltransferase MiaA [Sphingobacteriales bacterium TSM_CSM]PSJ74875.1 tRNA (adenosine(37)-N6)-dimethylallyltransferase MiaA [Sphingobacteriales bacterium UPWRP_1]
MKTAKYLVVIAGPTASGKSALAVQLAKQFDTVVVSADSRQLFREMSIGTAKPAPGEMGGVLHYLIDSHSITTPYSAGDYEREALQLLSRLFKQHDVVIMAGGSGLYFRAVCHGVDDFPQVQDGVRQYLQQLFQQSGLAALQKLLQEKDPDYYSRVDLNNPQRIMRALEVCLSSGKPYSSFRTGQPVQRPFTCLKIALEWDKETLYRRINQRVDDMMDKGLLNEARNLYALRHLNALQTVGYQELFDYIEGKTTLQQAVELIKRNTRRYAKRQLTWLRKEPDIYWFKANDAAQITAFLQQQIHTNR